MEQRMHTARLFCWESSTRIARRIHSFIPCEPKVRYVNPNSAPVPFNVPFFVHLMLLYTWV